MSPIDFTSNDLDREHNGNIDELANCINAGRQPSPSQITKWRGENTIKPYIITAATSYDGAARKLNQHGMLHFTDIEYRPRYFGLGFENSTPEGIAIIYRHDFGEDRCEGTPDGVYILNELEGKVFGARHKRAVEALSDVRGEIFQKLEDIILGKMHKEGRDLEVSDVLTSIDYIKNLVGNPKNQLKALRGVEESVKRYRGDIPKFGWDASDVRYAIGEIINPYLDAIRAIKVDGLLSVDYLVQMTEPLFNDFLQYLQNSSDLSPNCILKIGEPTIIHNIRHLQYGPNDPRDGGSYLDDMVSFAIANPDIGFVVVSDKNQDGVDNIRKSPENTDYRHHRMYTKALGVNDMSTIYLRHLKKTGDKKLVEMEMIHLYFQTEILKAVVKNYGQLLQEYDDHFIGHRSWTIDQFGLIMEKVGPNTSGFIGRIRELSTKDSNGARESREFIKNFDELTEYVGRRKAG